MGVVIVGGNECMVCQYEKSASSMVARQKSLQETPEKAK